MKYFVLLFFICLFVQPVLAGTWNRYPYQVIPDRSYRQNYTQQVNYKTVPYTQNRYGYTYNSANYMNYTNSMNNYNINRMSDRYKNQY